MIPITLDLGSRTVDAVLNETPTAVDLAGLLPLSADFTDFAGQEKLAMLPRRLTTRGAPQSSAAAAGDIGYYAPSQHLVLYYSDVKPFPGIIPVGRFTAEAIGLISALPSGAAITVAEQSAARS